jgi:prepilin-type N-terminal cleavage/methylation domain-containing protein/prepilin-type processing-associated H-X9-DG protein
MTHRNTRRAFTLIELLVVIAIIAILAAILFPVFAQAKTAAKSATEISNFKQFGTAGKLYLADYDDAFFPRGTMNGNGASWGTGACSANTFGCPNWDIFLQPYMKNVDMFESPFDRTPKVFMSASKQGKRSYRVAGNVVYGWAGINTWDGGNYMFRGTKSETSIPNSAGTILVTAQRSPAAYNCTWWAGAAFWECGVWWSASQNTISNEDSRVWGGEMDPARRYTMGIDFAAANKAPYLFVDGHVKTHPRGFIFPGYDRKLNMGSPIDNTLPGVCVDGDAAEPNANDCRLPE